MNDWHKKEISSKNKNISEWYTDVILKSGLADYGPARGTMVFMPYSYALWEQVQKVFNKMMRKKGVRNAYFPMFIPYSLLEKEKKHVEGFSPELAVVTHGGGEKLKEPLIVRPTSETVMYYMYARWIHSWRDLPLLINQWNNVVRWEKRTYLFLRTTEFLWQEGHTAHATEKEAVEMALTALEWYRKIYEEYFAIPVILGVKSESEKFAGAKVTYTVELLIPDGKALQGATSHNLSQNFSRTFQITFQDKKGNVHYVYQTSWGISTRSLGGLILVHGDDDGLVLPPKVAPVKVAIVPIFGKNDGKIMNFCRTIKNIVEKFNSEFPGDIKIFDDQEKSFGFRVNDVELKGVPVILKIGASELSNKKATLSYRLKNVNSRMVQIDNIAEEIEKALSKVQKTMFNRAEEFLKNNISEVDNFEEFQEIMQGKKGFLKAFWCEDKECELAIKQKTKATTRALPINTVQKRGKCVYCGKEAVHRWYFAQAY